MVDGRTLWAAVSEWARAQLLAENRTGVALHNMLTTLRVAIYVRDGDPYHLHNPRIYRFRPGEEGFYEAKPERLPDRAEITHVVVGCYHVPMIGDRYWASWDEFAGEMRFPGYAPPGKPLAPGE